MSLSNLKKQKVFFKTVEGPNVDIFWNGIPIEILGNSTIEIDDDDYDITTNLQNDFTKTSNISRKKLSVVDRVMYQDILKSLDYENYKPNLEKLNQVNINTQKTILMIIKIKF